MSHQTYFIYNLTYRILKTNFTASFLFTFSCFLIGLMLNHKILASPRDIWRITFGCITFGCITANFTPEFNTYLFAIVLIDYNNKTVLKIGTLINRRKRWRVKFYNVCLCFLLVIIIMYISMQYAVSFFLASI